MRLLHWGRGKKDNHKMATHGRLEKFEPEKDDWTIYVESLRYYFLANEVTTEAKKRSILLTCCGRGTLKLLRSLVDDLSRNIWSGVIFGPGRTKNLQFSVPLRHRLSDPYR